MNEGKNIYPSDKINTELNVNYNKLQRNILDSITDAENISKEKYSIKTRLIENATDLTTNEKLEALDKNYDRRSQELWQNIVRFVGVSICIASIAFGTSTISTKKYNKLINAA